MGDCGTRFKAVVTASLGVRCRWPAPVIRPSTRQGTAGMAVWVGAGSRCALARSCGLSSTWRCERLGRLPRAVGWKRHWAPVLGLDHDRCFEKWWPVSVIFTTHAGV